jgi:hypothetical protein
VGSKPRLLDLPHGHQTTIDEADWPEVSRLTLYRGKNGYVYYSTWENGRSVPRTLHGFLLGFPKGCHTDHINGDKLDNRRENLRSISAHVNQVNRKRVGRNNRSGIRGVSRSFGKWRAQITFQRKNYYLGLFENLKDAAAARKAAELRFYGELCPSHAS